MTFLPIENITYHSPLPLSKVKERLALAIKPEDVVRAPFKRTSEWPFAGYLDNDHFKVEHIIHYRNSFNPTIKGYFHPTDTGTSIEVEMRLSISVIIFLTIWCGAMGGVLIAELLSNGENDLIDVPVLLPPLLILFAYFVSRRGFNKEAKMAKIELADIFESKKVT